MRKKHLVFYDGHCVFCTRGSEKLERLARPGSMERLDFQQRGVLEQFPELSYERCMKELILLTPDGKQLGGVQAIVHVLATRRWIGWVAFIYYLPILRQLLDLLYRFIAWNRYRIMGKAIAKGECESGACQVHFSIQKSEKNEGHLRGTDDLD